MKDEIVVSASFENLGVIAEFLQEKIKSTHLAQRKAWELLLVTDEICSHIIQFRKYDRTMGNIKIRWISLPDRIEVKIETSGIPFNPCEMDIRQHEKEEEMEEEILGGMCIPLVKKMVDEIRYARIKNCNILHLTQFKKAGKDKYKK